MVSDKGQFFCIWCLTNPPGCVIIACSQIGLTINPPCLGVAQLVERYLGVVEAVGSSPVTQTIENSRFYVV